MTCEDIINELINIFKNQIKQKKEKIIDRPVSQRIADQKKALEYIEKWKEDVYLLVKIEPFLSSEELYDEEYKNPSYFSYTVSMIRSLDVLTEEQVKDIVEDKRINTIIANLKERLVISLSINEPRLLKTLKEIDVLHNIIELLSAYKADDYMDAELINYIYSYLNDEQYIKYYDKLSYIGQLIANYNILVHQKRTSR